MTHQAIAMEFRGEKKAFAEEVKAQVNIEEGDREERFRLAIKFVRWIEVKLRYRRLFDRNGQELFTVHDVVNAVLEDRWTPYATSPRIENGISASACLARMENVQ